MLIALAVLILLAQLATLGLLLQSRIRSRRQIPNVEVMKRIHGRWESFGIRPEKHKDVKAALETPGLAVRRSGIIEEGRQ